MTNHKTPVEPLRKTQPGTFLFRVGLVLVAGVLLVWLAGSLVMAQFFPPQWALTVTEPVESTGFSRKYQTEAECDVVLAHWQAEAERFKAQGEPAKAPSAACRHL
jgi:hypothetical protein